MLSVLKLASRVSPSDRLDRQADAEFADVTAPGEAQAALKALCAVSPCMRLHSWTLGLKEYSAGLCGGQRLLPSLGSVWRFHQGSVSTCQESKDNMKLW